MLFPNAGVELNPALLLLLGLMVGTLSGFFGVGGGFLITSGLLVFGVPPVFAVGTGLTVIMGTSMINALKHRKVGNVDSKLGALMVVGSIPAMLLAWRVNSQLETWEVAGPVIRYVYVIFLVGLGSFILYDFVKTRNQTGLQEGQVSTARLAQRVRSLRIPPHSLGVLGRISVPTYVSLPASNVQRISAWVPIGIGFGVGFLSGLLGTGGGFILMPVLIFVLGIPTTVAVGTDLFQMVITASAGTLLYSLSNRVDLLIVVIMLAATSIGSQLGVAATRFVGGARIRFLFGITIFSGGVAVALKQASESSASLDFLSTFAAVLLLGMAGTMCVLIAVTLLMAKGGSREPVPQQSGRSDTHHK